MHLDISVCTFSAYDTEGFLGIQVGALAEGSHGVTPGHQLSPLGLDARPVDPIKKGEVGSLAIRIPDGHQEFVLPCNDVRTEAALPNLAKGATRLFDTGTFEGFPFHFTITLDPIAQSMESKSHRPGGVWRYVNAETLSVAFSGTEVSITNATAVKCGGELPLAVAALVAAQLTALKSAVASAATTEAAASGMGGMTALNGFLSAWPTNVAATITKGA